MEFTRSGAPPDPDVRPTGGGGVAGILAAYGVEPAKTGDRPEVEDEEEEQRPRSKGSSGEGGRPRGSRRWSNVTPDRQRLIDKYPAIRDGGD